MSVAELKTLALQLPDEERLELSTCLADSLTLDEAVRRSEELDSGQVEGVPDEMMKRVQANRRSRV